MMFRLGFRVLCVVHAALLAACGTPDEDDTGPAGSSGGETSDSGETTALALLAECGLPQPCDAVRVPCELHASCADAAYSEAMLCAFEALANGSPAQLHYDFNGGGTGEELGLDLAIVGDSSAIVQYSGEDPDSLSDWVDPMERCMLAASDWFSMCAAVPEGDPMHNECMDAREWLVGDCTMPATCP